MLHHEPLQITCGTLALVVWHMNPRQYGYTTAVETLSQLFQYRQNYCT